MKRISTVVVAAAATAALVLSGCSSEEEPAEASGLRKNTATAQTAPQTESGESATTETTAPGDEGTQVSETTEPDEDSAADAPAANRPSDTTCGQFKELDEPQQQQLIGQILADNPDSAFVGNPNAALGTAKLVCNSEKLADQRVAVVAGIVVDG
ncbi:hypothetical protein [Nocardia jinanensis]|uniref:DUF732 domain-containing protein n=1 Tax=Nocardia jinanensis TaxID=382504 RepID=A0A917VX74_9NOCA|nr:hypothetical protein [Nocardia jinanensis]GGL28507.1 hypothetical protein GCM10011588_49190 [Nocardia jinanensis]